MGPDEVAAFVGGEGGGGQATQPPPAPFDPRATADDITRGLEDGGAGGALTELLKVSPAQWGQVVAAAPDLATRLSGKGDDRVQAVLLGLGWRDTSALARLCGAAERGDGERVLDMLRSPSLPAQDRVALAQTPMVVGLVADAMGSASQRYEALKLMNVGEGGGVRAVVSLLGQEDSYYQMATERSHAQVVADAILDLPLGERQVLFFEHGEALAAVVGDEAAWALCDADEAAAVVARAQLAAGGEWDGTDEEGLERALREEQALRERLTREREALQALDGVQGASEQRAARVAAIEAQLATLDRADLTGMGAGEGVSLPREQAMPELGVDGGIASHVDAWEAQLEVAEPIDGTLDCGEPTPTYSLQDPTQAVEGIRRSILTLSQAEQARYRRGYWLTREHKSVPPGSPDLDAVDAFERLEVLLERSDIGVQARIALLDDLLGAPTDAELGTDEGRLQAATILRHQVLEHLDVEGWEALLSSDDLRRESAADFEAAYHEAVAEGGVSDNELALLQGYADRFLKRDQAYAATNDTLGSVATTIAGVAVALAVSALCPVASPFVVQALLGCGAGAVAGLAANGLVQGEQASPEELRRAALEGGLAGAIGPFADAMAGLTVARVTVARGGGALASREAASRELSAIAVRSGGGRAALRISESTVSGMIDGGLSEGITTAVRLDYLKRSARESAWAILSSTLTGMVIGGATGAAFGGLAEGVGAVSGKGARTTLADLPAGLEGEALQRAAADALGVAHSVDASLPTTRSVKVEYEWDDWGRVSGVTLRYGAKAEAADILAHQAVIETLQRYQGFSGALRVLRDRIGLLVGSGRLSPGQPGFDAAKEVEKLAGMVDAHLAAREGLEAGSAAHQQLEDDLASLQAQMVLAERALEARAPSSGEIWAKLPEERARRAANYEAVSELVGKPLPKAPPEGYHYRRSDVDSEAVTEIVRKHADDHAYAPLRVDGDGRVQWGTTTETITDRAAASEYVTSAASLSPASELTVRQRNPSTGAKEPTSMTVSDAVKRRTELLASGDLGEASRITEELGLEAARKHMAEAYPGCVEVYAGRGSGTLDQVFRNAEGKKPAFIVVEAKGGSSSNSVSREVTRADGSKARVQQGHPDYAKDVLVEMRKRERIDEDLGMELEEALGDGEYEYIEVSQPISASGELSGVRTRQYDTSLKIGESTSKAEL